MFSVLCRIDRALGSKYDSAIVGAPAGLNLQEPPFCQPI